MLVRAESSHIIQFNSHLQGGGGSNGSRSGRALCPKHLVPREGLASGALGEAKYSEEVEGDRHRRVGLGIHLLSKVLDEVRRNGAFAQVGVALR